MSNLPIGNVNFGTGGNPERLLPDPPPSGILYGQATVDALRARIAELEALLRQWRERRIPPADYEGVRLAKDTDAALGTENPSSQEQG